MNKIEQIKEYLSNKKDNLKNAGKVAIATALTAGVLLSGAGCEVKPNDIDTSKSPITTSEPGTNDIDTSKSPITTSEPGTNENQDALILIDQFKTIIAEELSSSEEKYTKDSFTEFSLTWGKNDFGFVSHLKELEHYYTGEKYNAFILGAEYKTKTESGFIGLEVKEEDAFEFCEKIGLKQEEMDDFKLTEKDIKSLSEDKFEALKEVYEKMVNFNKEYTQEEMADLMIESFNDMLKHLLSVTFDKDANEFNPEFQYLLWGKESFEVLKKVSYPDFGINDYYSLEIHFKEPTLFQSTNPAFEIPVSKDMFDKINYAFGLPEEYAYLLKLDMDNIDTINFSTSKQWLKIIKELDTYAADLLKLMKDNEKVNE